MATLDFKNAQQVPNMAMQNMPSSYQPQPTKPYNVVSARENVYSQSVGVDSIYGLGCGLTPNLTLPPIRKPERREFMYR